MIKIQEKTLSTAFIKNEQNEDKMDKLKKLFGGNKDADSATSSAPTGASSGAVVENAKNVTLHTTLGDINIELYASQTPRVSKKAICPLHHSFQAKQTQLDLHELCHLG